MRGTTPAAIAIVGVLCETPILQSTVTLLTIPQQDRIRSRMTAASASVSANGRYVAFVSYARLSPADLDDLADIYVFDRVTSTVTLESVEVEGIMLNADCNHPRISGDGRYLTFEVVLTSNDLPRQVTDVVLRDRRSGTTRRISGGTGGAPANGWSANPAISDDGRVVAFASSATNLLPERDGNGLQPDIYLFTAGTTAMRRISVDSNGQQHSGGSVTPTVSADGRYVAFSSTAALAPVRGNQAEFGQEHVPAIYIRDTSTGLTTGLVRSGPVPNGASMSPAISGDAKYVAFASRATNLISGDRNRSPDVFLAEASTGAATLVSRGINGGTANGTSANPGISADGRFVVFQSDASDLACARCAPDREDINLLPDVFIFDRATRTVTCLSAAAGGGWMEESVAPAVDAAGHIVAFSSRHPISPRDVANDFDLFLRIEEPAAETREARSFLPRPRPK